MTGVLEESNSHLTFLRAGPLAPMDIGTRRSPSRRFGPQPPGEFCGPRGLAALVASGAREAGRRLAPQAQRCAGTERRLPKSGLQTAAPAEASLHGSRRCPARALRNALRNRSGLAPTARTWRGGPRLPHGRPASPHPAAWIPSAAGPPDGGMASGKAAGERRWELVRWWVRVLWPRERPGGVP